MHPKKLARTSWIVSLLILATTPALSADDAIRQDPAEIGQIRDLLHLYAFFLDDGRGDEFEELFAEDAAFDVLDMRLRGRATIRKQFVGPPGRLRKHLAFPAVIEIRSPTEALAWSDFIMVRLPDPDGAGPGEVYQMGRYHDRLVKQDDGRWRFAARNVFLVGMENTAEFLPPPGRRAQ
ncbi:MAG: hypothetical protein CL908_22935 [Deltaproteobacteria bacterium]|nr:hypothetical protein [Deltaproteobacteria bacterium]